MQVVIWDSRVVNRQIMNRVAGNHLKGAHKLALSKIFVRQIFFKFQRRFQVGECWGYNRFVSLERLKNFLVDGQLKIKFAVKPTNFQTQLRDLGLYASFLESKVPG